MRKLFVASACALALLPVIAVAAPDDHAPIGVMGDHQHKKGEWMFSYKYRDIHSSGFRNGNERADVNSVLIRYGEGAVKMDMRMHMFEAMYGISDDLTLMIMPQYMTMGMTHKSLHGGGHEHRHDVTGFGDTEVTGLYSLYRGAGGRVHLNAGVSLPTGSIAEKFADHHNNIYHMPYNMQFGSGTVDPIIGLTYAGEEADWSWGAQTLNYLRMGKNNVGYRQGNKYTATVWGARNVTPLMSLSLRLEGEAWGNVSGRDAGLPPTTIAGAEPDEQAGERLLVNAGVNLLGTPSMGILNKHRLAFEVGVPVYERYSGPQPDTGYRFTVGWQRSF